MMHFRKTKRRPLFIHIGYPKTASTYLQRRLFAGHPEINSLMDVGEFALRVYKIQQSPDALKALEDVDRDDLTASFSKTRTNVISSEGIVDFYHFLRKNNLEDPIGQTLREFRDLFEPLGFEVKFLMFIRQQASALISKYAEHYGVFSMIDPDFEDETRFREVFFRDGALNAILRDSYDYAKTLRELQETGCDFRVFLYEEYGSHTKRLIWQVARFMGVDPVYALALSSRERTRVTPKISKYEYYASRSDDNDHKTDSMSELDHDKVLKLLAEPIFANPGSRYQRLQNYLKLLTQKTESYRYKDISDYENIEKYKIIKFSDDDVRAIQDYYGESNSAIEKELGLKLSRYGYFV